MSKIEVVLPTELFKDIETYIKQEGVTMSEFVLWALGEKVGEIRQGGGMKHPQQTRPAQETVRSNRQINLPSETDTSHLLKASEVAKYLQISKSSAYNLMKSGEIPVIRIGKAIRVRVQDLDVYLQQNRNRR